MSAALAAVAVGAAWLRIARYEGIDYYAAWAAARAVAEGRVDDPWSEPGRARMGRDAASRALRPDAPPRERSAAAPVLTANRGALPTAGTPFFFTVLGAPSTGDYEADYVFFSLTALLLHVAAILGLCRVLGYPVASSLVALALLTSVFVPYLSGEGVGNVHAIQLALLSALPLTMSAERPEAGMAAAGTLLAFGVAFKPNLLPVAFPFLVSLVAGRRVRPLLAVSAGALAGTALALASSALFFGRLSCWLEWWRTLPELLRPPYPVSIGNYSLATVLLEGTGIDAALPLLALAVGGFAVFEAVRRAGGGSPLRSVEVAALAGLGGTVLLWTARLAWIHYFVFAIPLLLLALGPAREENRVAASPRERWVAAIAAGGFLPLGRLVPSLSPLSQALVLHVANLALSVVALRILWRLRRGPAPIAR